MLPLSSKIAFLLFALITASWGFSGFYRLYCRIHQGRPDPEPRLDGLPARLGNALLTTLTQQRTFKKRPTVGLFHSFIFYGFTFYLLVNLVDALEGFFPLNLQPTNHVLTAYLFLADILSFLVLLGVLALIVRRFLLPSRRDFRFNPRTLLHPRVQQGRITRDSLIVSAFILFHVGSRALGSASHLVLAGPNPAEPFASLISHVISPTHAEALRIFGFWGALGSVLAFLAYFPYTKHIHLFMAPVKYTVARRPSSGVIPPLDLKLEESEPEAGSRDATPPVLGAKHLEDLSWPRLLDAYACIQCNRCQDVCPASATGKSLSPAALEINKRMELNTLAAGNGLSPFETGVPSPRPLLEFALSPEAAWACTTCGACIDVCPVGDEQMLDILDIRRHQVMVEGDFPAQLQTAFRGMERAQNPWGINRAKRMDWAEGLNVPTTAENAAPDVLYWVGCAASYDPSAQKTARAFVQLLDHAGVDFAVLGKAECCTGDSARRAGNEYLYRQLADENVSTLNTLAPKLIVASCPHCMNSIGNEYKQIGGDYKVLHHTQYLESLVASGKLTSQPAFSSMTYHDPCYLGRHNNVYDAPRNLLNILSNNLIELPRNRENAFCCGAGGAQFWKEEEEGDQRIADNRFQEVQQTLANSTGEEKILAVGCPFCKSMLSSTPLKAHSEDIVIKDVAELLLEALLKTKAEPEQAVTPNQALPSPGLGILASASPLQSMPTAEAPILDPAHADRSASVAASEIAPGFSPGSPTAPPIAVLQPPGDVPSPAVSKSLTPPPNLERKKWQPKQAASSSTPETAYPSKTSEDTPAIHQPAQPTAPPLSTESAPPPTPRPKWQPRTSPTQAQPPDPQPRPAALETPAPDSTPTPPRKKWNPKNPSGSN